MNHGTLMFAIIDLETTGLDPKTDRIIEVAILLFDGRELTESFSSLVNPGVFLSPQITRLTGISDEQLLPAPPFFRIARKIVQLTQCRILVAHNVRFDYGFLRQEYQRLGYNFSRKLLCTERLCRKKYQGLPSYRLSRVCRFLDIERNGQHRALADAQVTLTLFKKLQSAGDESVSVTKVRAQVRETILPPAFTRSQVMTLPEKTGVYSFFDASKRLLYVGKSTNIRKRVMGHFSGDIKSPRLWTFKNQIQEVRYEVTGSELVALLLESDLIKKLQPPYNRAQRQVRYRYGVFSRINARGYREIYSASLVQNSADEAHTPPLIAFSNKKDLDLFLDRLVRQFHLCQKWCGLYRGRRACFHYHINLCHGACAGEEAPAEYNRRVEAALQQLNYESPNFFVITRGRHEKERAIVMVENGLYRGFGFVSLEWVNKADLPKLRAGISPREDNQDIRRIIRQFVKRHKNARILEY